MGRAAGPGQSEVTVSDAVNKTDARVPSPAGFNSLLVSHVLYVLCGLAYSAYWILQEGTPGAAAVSALVLAVLLGFGGAAAELVASGVSQPKASPYSRLGTFPIAGACLAILIVTWFVTTVVMGRPFTSELIYVTAWAALELSSLDDAHGRGWIGRNNARAAAVVVGFAFAFGLACYAVYYLLDGRARFYAGLVPYILFSLAMLVVTVLLVIEKKKPGGATKSQ